MFLEGGATKTWKCSTSYLLYGQKGKAWQSLPLGALTLTRNESMRLFWIAQACSWLVQPVTRTCRQGLKTRLNSAKLTTYVPWGNKKSPCCDIKEYSKEYMWQGTGICQTNQLSILPSIKPSSLLSLQISRIGWAYARNCQMPLLPAGPFAWNGHPSAQRLPWQTTNRCVWFLVNQSPFGNRKDIAKHPEKFLCFGAFSHF